MTKRRNYKDLPDIELPEELDAIVRAKTEVADKQIEETRVNFRWGREQLNLVKKVADVMGVPYQTYIKQVLFKQALVDLEASLVATAPEAIGVGTGIAAWNRRLPRVYEPSRNPSNAAVMLHTWLRSSFEGLADEAQEMTVRELLEYLEKAASERPQRAGR
jgi:predicted DNA binding CopG/RHH family protein